MSDFNGAWDHSLVVDSGYYDEEYDDDPPVCERCSRRLKPSEETAGICGECASEEEDEES